VSSTIVCGTAISNLVCYTIWPQSATSALQTNMTTTLDSFSTLLSLVTSTFLLEDGLQQPSHERIAKAAADHQNSFTSLKRNLKEAQNEWIVAGSSRAPGGRVGRAYEDAVDSMNRLAQHLNGLRGGTRLQYDLAKSCAVGQSSQKASANTQDADSNAQNTEFTAGNAAAEEFADLFNDLGPPLKALSVSITGRSVTLFSIPHRQRAHHPSCGCVKLSSTPGAAANTMHLSSTSSSKSLMKSSAR
jgi:hypothetical protein